MNKYKIGIIDEDTEDVQDIERTIIINKPENIQEEQVQFYEYPISFEATELLDSVIHSAVDDIINDNIQLLIIDYKIIVNTSTVEGTDILRSINDKIPKFPVIILSNVPDDCYTKEFVDADKVYSKRSFFKIEEEYSKEKTLNLFRNMEHYSAQRAKLVTKLNHFLLNLEDDGYTEQTLKNIIEIEKKLDEFCPQQQSIIEKTLDLSELQTAVNLLKEANELIGGYNENR